MHSETRVYRLVHAMQPCGTSFHFLDQQLPSSQVTFEALKTFKELIED